MHPCGLHLIIGKKGGGKSMLATKLMTRILAETRRIIITNLPLNFPEIRSYMAENWPLFKDDLKDRITVITEAKLLKRFWLSQGNDWWIPDVSKEAWNLGQRLDFRTCYRWLETTKPVKNRLQIPDMELEEIKRFMNEDPAQIEAALVEDRRPCQFIIDELQNIFPARGFMQTSQGCLFWLSQQRHLGADFIGITQSADLIDKEFRDLADDFLYITNWGRKQKSFFRLPAVMTWSKYDMKPGPGIKPMVTGFCKVDISGIGKLYDTSAGVGIEGGLTADTGEKVKGLHWSIAVGIFIILLCSLFLVPKAVLFGVKHLFGSLKKNSQSASASIVGTDKPAGDPAQVNTNTLAKSILHSLKPGDDLTEVTINSTNVTKLVGLGFLNGVHWCFLNDGSIVRSDDIDRFKSLIIRNRKIIGAVIDGRPLLLDTSAPTGRNRS